MQTGNPAVPPMSFPVVGGGPIGMFWFGLYSLRPDTMIRVSDVKVHLSSDSKLAKITMKARFTSTEMFDVEYVDNVQGVAGQLAKLKRDEVSNTLVVDAAEVDPSKPDLLHVFASTGTTPVRAPKLAKRPFMTIIDGTITMITDEDKKISRLEFNTDPWVTKFL
eukprot:gene3429-4415_t